MIDNRINFRYDGGRTFIIDKLVKAAALPEAFSLGRVYPNPFNPTTTINFALPVQTKVILEAYDINGRITDVLIDHIMDKGYHAVIWNADSYSSGVYFVKMLANDYIYSQKLMLVK